MKKKFALGFASLLFAAACSKDAPNAPQPTTPINVTDVQALGQSNEAFGLDLFNEVVKRHPNENVLISPWSVQTAFLMALNGAQGATAVQIQQALYAGLQSPDTLNYLQQQLQILMEKQSGRAMLKSANAFFYDNNRLLPEQPFLQTLTKFYSAQIATDNFADPNAKKRINDWVKQNTNGKIEEIVKNIGPDDLAFLINAIHFKSDWERGFPTAFVFNRNFTEFNGSTANVPFVTDDNNFLRATYGGFEMVEVPFKDKSFSLHFIMPAQPKATTNWVEQLTPALLHQLYNGVVENRLLFGFPKFDLSFDVGLVEDLQNLGITNAFQPSAADFSQLGTALTGPTLYIKTVAHSAVLTVDEKGAEGAAVTSLGFATTSMPPTLFFDRPFVVILKHNATKTQLFTGLVGAF